MVTAPHKMVGLERMSDYRGVGFKEVSLYMYAMIYNIYVYDML